MITVNLSYVLIRNDDDDDIDDDAFRMDCTMRSELWFECIDEQNGKVDSISSSSSNRIVVEEDEKRKKALTSYENCALVLEKMSCEQRRDMHVLIVNSKTNKTVNSLIFTSPRTKEFKLKRRSRNMLSPRRRRRSHLVLRRRRHEVSDLCTCTVPGLCVMS